MRLVFAFAAAVVLWSPAVAEEKSPEQVTEEKLDAVKLSLCFEETPVEDVAAFFADFTGVNVILDPKAGAESKSVTLTVKDLSLRNCADLVLDLSGLEQVNWRGRLVWTTPERAESLKNRSLPACPQGAPEADRKMWEKCASTKLDLDFSRSTLADILSFIQDFSGVHVVVETGADESLSLRLKNMTLLDVLDFLAFLLGGELQLRPGSIAIAK